MGFDKRGEGALLEVAATEKSERPEKPPEPSGRAPY